MAESCMRGRENLCVRFDGFVMIILLRGRKVGRQGLATCELVEVRPLERGDPMTAPVSIPQMCTLCGLWSGCWCRWTAPLFVPDSDVHGSMHVYGSAQRPNLLAMRALELLAPLQGAAAGCRCRVLLGSVRIWACVGAGAGCR